MREIKFRAVSKLNGDWVYGSYVKHLETIQDEFQDFDIYIETLGQYTGLKDKNGTKIFEGDIVEMHYFFENHDPSTLGVFEDENYIKGYLIYDKLGLVLIDKNHDKYRVSDYVQEPCEELEVIGNIYDNPELLEGL